MFTSQCTLFCSVGRSGLIYCSLPFFGFKFIGINVSERERRAKNRKLWPNYGQSKQLENSELVILSWEKLLEVGERLKILTESKSAGHVYSSMHTI